MTYETYNYLIRAVERRIAGARIVGAWDVVAEACAELVELRRKFQEEYSPEENK